MGTIGQKLAKSLQEEKKESPSLPHDNFDDLQDVELEELTEEMVNFPQQLIEEGCHPHYALYMIVETILTVFTQTLIDDESFEDYFEVVDEAEEEYMPDYPPMSPITNTFFSAWSQFDLTFGTDLETLASCLIENVDQLDLPLEMIQALQSLQDSRMGIFEHCGFSDEFIRLKELITGDTFQCYNPTGYQGQTGELWFVRRCEPPFKDSDCSILYNTPYILRDFCKQDWVEYLERSIAESEIDDERDALHDFMKYGDYPEMWLDYIMDGYSDFQDDAIFLTGIPDIEESLPHALRNDSFDMVPLTEEIKPSTKSNNLFFDNSSLKNSLVAVSEQDEILEEYKKLRTDGVELVQNVAHSLSQDMIYEGAERLGLIEDGAVIYGSDNETSVLLEYCAYHVFKNGKNAFEQFGDNTQLPEDSYEMNLIRTGRLSNYSMFEVSSTQPRYGVTLCDLYSGEIIPIVDLAFSMSACEGNIVVTRILHHENFSASGGTSIPMGILSKQQKQYFTNLLKRIKKPDKNGRIDPAPLVRACLEGDFLGKAFYFEAFSDDGQQNSLPQLSHSPLGISIVQPPSVRKVMKRDAVEISTGEIIQASSKKTGRNEPCPCGSHKKYKKCCLKK